MKSSIINSIFFLVIGFSLLNCIPVKEAVVENEHEGKILLSIENDREEGFLLFSVTNEDTEDLLTSPVGSNHSRVILIAENGKVIEHYSMVDIQPTKLRKGETKVWRTNIRPMLEHHELQNEKNLKMIWSVNGVKSAPFIINQRN